MASVYVNPVFIQRLPTWGPVDRDIYARAAKTWGHARAGPVRTGRYVRSMRIERAPGGRGGWRVIAEVDYAWIIERGSRPHPIYPRRKKALWWPGAPHPYGKVNHPGTKPVHNMARALEAGARGRTRIR